MPKDIDGVGTLLLFLVGTLWGLTNPIIERSVNEKKDYNPQDFSPKSVISVASSKLFIIGFAINQVGSVIYAMLLHSYGEQYTSLIANSITTVWTFLGECWWKGMIPSWKEVCGMGSVLLGIYFILE